jgi:hypothetical protein
MSPKVPSMEKLMKLTHSPFTSNIEVFDDLVMMLFEPSSDKVVTLQLNPNIHDYQAQADKPGIQMSNVTLAVGKPQIHTFDFGDQNTLAVKFNKKHYEIKLQRIEPVEIQGQKFHSYEFFVSSRSLTTATIIQPGTVNFWIDPKKNPGAFTPGVNYTWIRFQLGSETCAVSSEGTKLIGVLNPGSELQVRIFSVVPTVDPNRKHMVTLGWDSERLELSFDAELIYEIAISDFLSPAPKIR